jgi:hypothetical protein
VAFGYVKAAARRYRKIKNKKKIAAFFLPDNYQYRPSINSMNKE